MKQDFLHYARIRQILSQFPLFNSLQDDLLENMLDMLEYDTYTKDNISISPKQASDYLYLIISGRAKVSVYHPDSGREHILFLLGPGDCFDLVSLLDGEPHEAVATALDDMEVLFITVQQARDWIDQHPDFNRAFLPYLGKQIHMLSNQVVDLSLYDTETRLARLFLRHLVPDKLHQGIPLINDLSQETLASMIGSVRVVVTRHLQLWKQKKIISSNRRYLSVLNLQALLEKAEQQLHKRIQ